MLELMFIVCMLFIKFTDYALLVFLMFYLHFIVASAFWLLVNKRICYVMLVMYHIKIRFFSEVAIITFSLCLWSQASVL